MKHKEPEKWHVRVRKHTRDMVLLIAMFSLIAFFYRGWYLRTLDAILESGNDYHLASNLHYLNAIKELDKIQIVLATKQNVTDDSRGSNGILIGNPRDRAIATSLHLVTMHAQTGLNLEEKFRDPNFNSLALQLEKQINHISNMLRTKKPAEHFKTPIVNVITTTLNQLSRLHSIYRDNRVVEAEDLKRRQSAVFYVLLIALISSGFIVSIRGFKSINLLILEQDEYEKKIKYQAHYDSLTGLPNRLLALEQLDRITHDADRQKHKVGILFIDIDHFKTINDTLGHESGDQLLIESGERFKQSVRSNDIVGRLGGDEFIIILGQVHDVYDIRQTAKKLVQVMSEPFVIDNRKMLFTISIGISIYPEDGVSAANILRNADMAMYDSKKRGRNTYSYFDKKMNTRNLRNLEVEEQMHDALSREEFCLMYQPKIDVASGKIVGAEALLRWNNEKIGSISPDEFIPIAEQTGLIVSIGQFVLEEALAATSRLNTKNLSTQLFTMAVNLSPRQFRDRNLLPLIEKNLNSSGIKNHQLELEITEGIFISDDPYVFSVLNDLSVLGVNIAMDDFGTGYSSINYLRKYPFNVLKIDRSFVSDVESNPKDRELVNAAIMMGHNLDLKVVAEGVETNEQFALLKQLKCDYAQGYLFSKPITETKLEFLLKDADKPLLPATSQIIVKKGIVHH
mgnify:CR=1 FL=1